MEKLSTQLDDLLEKTQKQPCNKSYQTRKASSSSASSSSSSPYSSTSLASSYSSFSSCISATNLHAAVVTGTLTKSKPTLPPKPKPKPNLALTETTSKLFLNNVRTTPNQVPARPSVDYEDIISSLKAKIQARKNSYTNNTNNNNTFLVETYTLLGKNAVPIAAKVDHPVQDNVAHESTDGARSLLDEIYAEIEEKCHVHLKADGKAATTQFPCSRNSTGNDCCCSSTSSYESSNSSSNSCTCPTPPLPAHPPPPLSLAEQSSPPTPLSLQEEIQREILRSNLSMDTQFLVSPATPSVLSMSAARHSDSLLVEDVESDDDDDDDRNHHRLHRHHHHHHNNKNNSNHSRPDECQEEEEEEEETEYLEPILLQPPPKHPNHHYHPHETLSDKRLDQLLHNMATTTIPTSKKASSSFSLSPSKPKSYLLSSSSAASSNKVHSLALSLPQEEQHSSSLTTQNSYSVKKPASHTVYGEARSSSRSSSRTSQSTTAARASLSYLANAASSRFTSTLRLIRTKSSSSSSSNANSYSPQAATSGGQKDKQQLHQAVDSSFTSAWAMSTASIGTPTLISQTFDLTKQNLIDISGNEQRCQKEAESRREAENASSDDDDDSFDEKSSVCLSSSSVSGSSGSSPMASFSSSSSAKCLAHDLTPITINSNTIIMNVYEEDGETFFSYLAFFFVTPQKEIFF